MTAPTGRTRLRFEREWACILSDGSVLHGVQDGLGTLQYPTMPRSAALFQGGVCVGVCPSRTNAFLTLGRDAYSALESRDVFWNPRRRPLPLALVDAFAALKDTSREDLVAALFDPRPAVQRLAARRLQAVDSAPEQG